MLRWITAGRIVPEYPWPISEVKSPFCAANSPICASASVSLSATPRSSGAFCLIDGRQRLVHQIAERLRADGFQHGRDIARRGTDMAAHETGAGIVNGFKRRVHGVSSLVMPAIGVIPREGGVSSTP